MLRVFEKAFFPGTCPSSDGVADHNFSVTSQVKHEKPGAAILRGHEYYEFVEDLAAGAFGFVQKARDKETKDLVHSLLRKTQQACIVPSQI